MTARSPRPRGLSRVRRHTYDIDSREGAIHAPLGGDGTLESARLAIKALLLMIDEVQVATANAVQYSQGLFGRAGVAALKVLFDPKHGFDHFSGTDDLANSQIAERVGCNPRHWQRLKKRFVELGIITYVHRSMKTGLATAPGVDQDIQISDLYYFSPDDLARRAPWLREIYDQTLGRLKRERYARETREESRGKPPSRTPLVKRARPKCRIPALLNPVGWARCMAAIAAARAKPPEDYATREAEAIAFATRLASKAPPG